jgi:hypothetical protein
MSTIGDWWAKYKDGTKVETFEFELRRSEGQMFAYALKRVPVYAFEWLIGGYAMMMFGTGIIIASVQIESEETPWIAWFGLASIVLGFFMITWVEWDFRYKRSA